MALASCNSAIWRWWMRENSFIRALTLSLNWIKVLNSTGCIYLPYWHWCQIASALKLLQISWKRIFYVEKKNQIQFSTLLFLTYLNFDDIEYCFLVLLCVSEHPRKFFKFSNRKGRILFYILISCVFSNEFGNVPRLPPASHVNR